MSSLVDLVRAFPFSLWFAASGDSHFPGTPLGFLLLVQFLMPLESHSVWPHNDRRNAERGGSLCDSVSRQEITSECPGLI
jgi:hypothetical protein